MTQAKAKSNSVITHRVDSVGGADPTEVKIVFQVLGAGETVLDLSRVHADVRAKALIHGMVQRVSDAAAIPRNTTTGKSASPVEKLEAMSALVEHYNSGASEWRLARAEGAGRGSYLLNALLELKPGKSREEISAWLKTLDDKTKRALENSDKIKPLIDKQRAAGAVEIDAEELLEGL
jgi:hypothetical protein